MYSDWLRAGRQRGRSSSPSNFKRFSPLPVIQTGFEAHPAFYAVSIGRFLTGVKLTTHLKAEPTSRISGSIHPLLHPSSWLSVKHRDNVTFAVELWLDLVWRKCQCRHYYQFLVNLLSGFKFCVSHSASSNLCWQFYICLQIFIGVSWNILRLFFMKTGQRHHLCISSTSRWTTFYRNKIENFYK
jgi:hypothetical protein